MADSAKILERDKRRLDRLREGFMASRGRRVSQQEILSWLLDLGEAETRRRTGVVARPMSSREIENLKRLVVRTGVRTQEEEIDRPVARAAR